MKQLPNLALSLKKIKVLIDLEEKVNVNTVLGYCIKNAFNKKEPNDEIIKTIRDSLNDNPNALDNVIPDYMLKDVREVCGAMDGQKDDLKDLKIFTQ